MSSIFEIINLNLNVLRICGSRLRSDTFIIKQNKERHLSGHY
jgi:hypothetical protein